MRSFVAFLVIALVVVSIAAGCAPGANPYKAISEPTKPAGFWLGVWHGFIALFVFVGSLFRSNLNIYEVHNNGAWYNLGYLFGLMCFFGGGGGGAARRR
jgi:hypothetical protein